MGRNWDRKEEGELWVKGNPREDTEAVQGQRPEVGDLPAGATQIAASVLTTQPAFHPPSNPASPCTQLNTALKAMVTSSFSGSGNEHGQSRELQREVIEPTWSGGLFSSEGNPSLALKALCQLLFLG
jgi:hypothetical protein